jgi:hypothetical protein
LSGACVRRGKRCMRASVVPVNDRSGHGWPRGWFVAVAQLVCRRLSYAAREHYMLHIAVDKHA